MILQKWRGEVLSVLVLLVIAAGLGFGFVTHQQDRSFIGYRIAQNLQAGGEFTYNPGEQPSLYDATDPIYVLLLSLANLSPSDLPQIGSWISAAAIAISGLFMFAITHRAGIAAALAAAILYITFPVLWITLGLDVTLWIALCLGSIWLVLKDWSLAAAILLGMTTLLRPETMVLAFALGIYLVISGKPFKPAPGIGYGVLLFAALLWKITTFGSIGLMPPALHPDAAGIHAPSGLIALGGTLFESSPIWLLPPLLALLGVLKASQERWVWPLVIWGGLHFLLLTVIGQSIYAWDLAPLIPALATLCSLGIVWIGEHLKIPGAEWAVGVVAALLAISPAVQTLLTLGLETRQSICCDPLHPTLVSPAYQEAGEWLLENTASSTRVGTATPGLLGYVSRRPMLALQGGLSLTKEDEGLPPGDIFSWLVVYAPDVLVLHSDPAVSSTDAALASDPWFLQTYVEAAQIAAPSETGGSSLVIYQRSGEHPPMSDILIDLVEMSPELTLNRISTDFPIDPLQEDHSGLIGLQWWTNASIEGTRYVAIRIENRAGAIVALNGRDLNFQNWPSRTLITTYHPIHVGPGLVPGIYDIEVGIGPDPFTITWYPAAQAKVPFSGGAFLGGISGTRAQFGAIDLLGYRLARMDQGLEVLLLWQSVEQLFVDYTVFIQVRDAVGSIASQMETQPLNGTYPTSVWSPSEQIPDTYLLDISALPPGDYEVFAGLLDADGRRLRTLIGQDAISIGRISISP